MVGWHVALVVQDNIRVGAGNLRLLLLAVVRVVGAVLEVLQVGPGLAALSKKAVDGLSTSAMAVVKVVLEGLGSLYDPDLLDALERGKDQLVALWALGPSASLA